jgi:hypothetical protein
MRQVFAHTHTRYSLHRDLVGSVAKLALGCVSRGADGTDLSY